MKRLINPFHYIAGSRALMWGLAVIVAETAWLCGIGFIQDSYLHFTPAPADNPLLKIAAMQLAMWLAPALLLGLCGLIFSRSKFRLIDLLGTTALAQAPMLLLLLTLSIGSLNDKLAAMAEAAKNGDMQNLPIALLLTYGLWSLGVLALFFIRNYQAFSVSCNLRGWRAVVPYIVVVFVVTLLSQYIHPFLV